MTEVLVPARTFRSYRSVSWWTRTAVTVSGWGLVAAAGTGVEQVGDGDSEQGCRDPGRGSAALAVLDTADARPVALEQVSHVVKGPAVFQADAADAEGYAGVAGDGGVRGGRGGWRRARGLS
jgi:hypothetical protein